MKQQRAEAERAVLARMLRKAFELWDIAPNERGAALGVMPDHPAITGGAALPPDHDVLDRAGHLLAIHAALRALFPSDRELAYQWMRTGNRAFDGYAPIAMIERHGLAGLLMVRGYLDRAKET